MQEESKLQYNKKSFESFQSSTKTSKKRPSWCLKSIFSCCQPPDPENEQNGPKKNVNSITTHYSNRGPASFVNTSKNCENLNIVLPESSFLLDMAFLLGKGSNKIICKISKVTLEFKSSNENDKSSESKLNKVVQETNQNKQFDFKPYDAMEICNGEQKGLRTSQFSRNQIFSMYFHGIQVEKSDWNEITPEIIAEYIALKLKGQIIIDAMSGYGGNTIQFAKQCPYVIGVEIEGYKLKKAKHNSGIYKVNNNIDFVHADFFSLKKLRADVVFLAPSKLPLEENTAFSVEKNLSPNLTQLVRHSLSIAESVCILLPPAVDIEEIAQLFCNIFNENPKLYSKMNYTIQIDLLYVDDNFVSTLVHFGGENSITPEEQRDVLFNTMNLNENPTWNALYPQTFIRRLFSYVGIQRSIMIISSIEEEFDSENRMEDTVFDVFIDSLKEQKIVTPEIIKMLQQSSDNESPLKDSDQSAGKFHKLLGSWDLMISGADGHSDVRMHGPDLSSKNTSPANKNLGIGYFYQSAQKGIGNHESANGNEHGTNSKSDNAKSSSVRWTQSQPIGEADLKEVNPGSLEVSEMALSSYSMKSAALLDSESDITTEYRLSLLEERENDSPDTKRSSISKKPQKKYKVPTKIDKSSLVEPGTDKASNQQGDRPVSGNFFDLKNQEI